MCRIQTFPDDLTFDCGRTDVQKMLGNAVPSLLAEVMAREIRRQLLGDKRDPGELKLLPPVRRPMPPPEALAPLPKAFLPLIADHADHPGEGRLQAKRKREAETLSLISAAE
jgi:DNA (cytosine-5)-methyltransferase 1